MTTPSTRAIQRFEVSLKAFILREGRVLLVKEADTGFWELPGGRIDVGEEAMASADILAREITEELGAAFRIRPRAETTSLTRRRPTDGVWQFLWVRACDHVSGVPALSGEHAAFAWTTPEDWARLEFPPEANYGAALAALWREVVA